MTILQTAMTRALHLAAAGLALAVFVALLNCPARAGLQEGVAAYEAGNLPQAMKEFRAGAETNDVSCQYNLAVMYEQGIGVAKDEKVALGWYRKAAELGNALAIGNLGMLYLRGDGVKIDKVAGVALLLQSATLDSSPENFAKRNLSTTRGLTPEIIAAAQALSSKMSDAKSLLVPLDDYLKSAATNATLNVTNAAAITTNAAVNLK